MLSNFNSQTSYQQKGFYQAPMQQPLYRMVGTIPVQAQVYHPYLQAYVSVVVPYPIYALNPFYRQEKPAPQEEKLVPLVEGREPQKLFNDDKPNIFSFYQSNHSGKPSELENGEAYLPSDLVEELDTPSESSTRTNTPF